MASLGMIGLLAGLPVLLCRAPAEDDKLRQAIEHVLEEWRWSDQAETESVTKALVALGKPASPELCQLLDERPPDKLPVEAVVAAIGQLGSPAAVPTLGRLSESEIESERLAAVCALGSLDTRECLPFFAKALDDESLGVFGEAEARLLGSAQKTEWKVMALTERAPTARDKGCIGRVLGRLEGDEAHRALLDMLEGIEESMVLGGLQGLWFSGRETDGATIARILREADSSGVEKQACLVLGKIRVWAAIPDLIEVLRSEDRGVVANAHWALREITGERLKAEPDLWQQWWDRSGSKKSGRGAGGP